MSTRAGTLPATVPFPNSKYTRDQREAIALAFNAKELTAPRVAQLAAEGELRLNGEQLEPFTVPEGTVRRLASRDRERRAGRTSSTVAQLPHREAVDALRIRLIACADGMLADLEQQKPGRRDPERLRQIARAAREAAAMPVQTDERPRKPGAGTAQKTRTEGATAGGLAGALVKAHRAEERQASRPAPDVH